MEQQHVFQSTDLKNLIREVIKEEFSRFKENINEARPLPENLVNIARVIKELGVSRATIYNWKAKGLIRPQKFGGKVLYNLSDILKDIKSNFYAFGKGRDYLYRNPDSPKQEAKNESRYYNLNWKVMAKKVLTPEEEEFYLDYQAKHRDPQTGILKKYIITDPLEEEIDDNSMIDD